MASRRTTRGKRAGKSAKGKTRAELLRLLAKARAEVDSLLEGAETGTLTGVNLKAGLEEIEENLHAMEPLERWSPGKKGQ
jgi:hypothetical protein